jgi:hypothetical protein
MARAATQVPAAVPTLAESTKVAEGFTAEDIAEKDRFYLTDDYKREVRAPLQPRCPCPKGRRARQSCGWRACRPSRLASLFEPRTWFRIGASFERRQGLPSRLSSTAAHQLVTALCAPPPRPAPQVVEHMSIAQLIDIILINPTVALTPSGRDTGFMASYTFAPLSNLVYTRDQQVSLRRGAASPTPATPAVAPLCRVCAGHCGCLMHKALFLSTRLSLVSINCFCGCSRCLTCAPSPLCTPLRSPPARASSWAACAAHSASGRCSSCASASTSSVGPPGLVGLVGAKPSPVFAPKGRRRVEA